MVVLYVSDPVTLWDLLVSCVFSCLRKDISNWTGGCWNNLMWQIVWIQVQTYLTLVKNPVPWCLQLHVSLWAACLLSGRLGEAQDCWWTWRPMKRLFIQTSSTVKMSLWLISLHNLTVNRQLLDVLTKYYGNPDYGQLRTLTLCIIHLLYLYPLTILLQVCTLKTHKSMPD